MEVLQLLAEEEKWQGYLRQPRACTILVKGQARAMQCSFDPATCTIRLTLPAGQQLRQSDRLRCKSACWHDALHTLPHSLLQCVCTGSLLLMQP